MVTLATVIKYRLFLKIKLVSKGICKLLLVVRQCVIIMFDDLVINFDGVQKVQILESFYFERKLY